MGRKQPSNSKRQKDSGGKTYGESGKNSASRLEGSFEERIDLLTRQDWDRAFALYSTMMSSSPDLVIVADVKDALKKGAKGWLEDWFLEWWYSYWAAYGAYEGLNGWIESPFNPGHDEDEVKAQVATQVTLLTDDAKKKLAERLRKRAKELRERAKQERKDGKTDKADKSERDAREYDTAASEAEKL